MGYRLSKITTRTGDDGKTHLGDGNRLLKSHARITALGELDELNSAIGLLLAHNPENQDIVDGLKQVQQDLFDLGGELCPPYREVIIAQHVLRLEQLIEKLNATLPPLKEFILPGGNITAATAHLARTICRRAERSFVKLHSEEPLNAAILQYLNRLSDLLFVAARIAAREASIDEVLWEHERKKREGAP